jgi:hypothetical protein
MYRGTMSTMIVLTIATSFLLSPTSSTEAARIGESLLLCLSFDEGNGSVAGDSSLKRFHGTVHGAEWVPGKFGNALKFDGIDDFVSVPDSPELRLLNGGTFMAWISYEGSGTKAWPRILSKEKATGGEGGYHMYLDQAGDFKVRVTVNGRGHTSPEAPEMGIWYHVAATCDGANIRIYLNGEKILEAPQEMAFPDVDCELQIGDSPAAERPFEGLIDEVRIWGRALSQDEVLQQMNMTTQELEELMKVDPVSKKAATWGAVKTRSEW